MATVRRALYRLGTYWRGSSAPLALPDGALLTEDGLPILTEDGQLLLVES
jgi:hypothetical protein